MSTNDGPLADSLPDPLVLKFYLYMVTVSHAFVTPITVVYMQSQGLGLAEVGVVQSAFWIGVILGEVPTGYLGDRFGRRTSLFVATALIAVAIFWFGTASSYPEFVAVYLLWAVGITFRSGSLGAWLYDALQEHLDPEEFARVRGRGNSVVLSVTAAGSLAGGVLYELDPRYPFLATGTLVATGLVVLWTFPRTAVDEDDDSDPFEFLEALRLMRGKIAGRQLRWFVVYMAVLYAASEVVSTFTQPTALAAGVSIEQLGVLFAGITGVSAVGSYFAGDVKETLGIRKWFAVAPVIVTLPLVAVTVMPLLAIPAIISVQLVDKVSEPLWKQYINDRTPSVGRATVLSGVSMAFGLVAVPSRIAAGALGDATSEFVMFAAVGGVVLLVSGLVYLGASPFAGEQPEDAGED